MHNGRRIYGLAVVQGWFKAHSICGCYRSIVQPMPKRTNHPIDPKLAIRAEHNFQKHFPFEFELPSFVGISRVRLVRYLHRGRRTPVVACLDFRYRLRYLLGRKTSVLNVSVALPIALARLRHTATEPDTRNRAFQPLGAAGTISRAWTLRKIECPGAWRG